MGWWGKLAGGAFGFLLGGPLGAVLGVALGHQFDRGLASVPEAGLGPDARERIQTAFFTATFSVMGAVAKADGRVSPEEIRLAEAVMAEMGLAEDQRRVAIRLFREGKSPTFPLDEVVAQLRRECGRRTSLIRMFLEIQLQAAWADGRLDPAEAALLRRIARGLGLDDAEYEALAAQVGAGSAGGGDADEGALADAYATLGVSPDASDEEVKRAYRRLMARHHPDKLVSKGLPEEMMRLAEQRTREIRRAWERIRAARGG